jgi:GxxExxY protein
VRIRPQTQLEIVEKELSYEIVRAFYDVYNELGYGLLESIYARAMQILLEERGLRVEREVSVMVPFHGHSIGPQRIDMMVEGRVVVELKASDHLAPAAYQQLRSYVKASRLRLGILLHFGPKPAFRREIGVPSKSPGKSFA